MGAIAAVRLCRATPGEFHAWRQAHRALLVGTSAHAECDYRDVAYRGPVLLYLGCEQHGIAPRQLRQCDVAVRIPIAGRADSLNVAVAAGVMLYQILDHQQHRSPLTASLTNGRAGVGHRPGPERQSNRRIYNR